MYRFRSAAALAGCLVVAVPAFAMPFGVANAPSDIVLAHQISRRPSDYSNGFGTNAANSEAVGRPVGRYGGYVVNQYGFGNYVSGPEGYGGYPAGSAGAQIWRQRERWKCENVPESC